MQELKIFEKEEFGKIRTDEIDGEVYFVASDVAKALGYKDTISAIKQHCRWVVKHHIPHSQSKTKTLEINVIPKGDIVRLAANSELPGAEKFESWIFNEVIPSVLNHGMYATDEVINKILDNPDFGIELLRKLKEERAARIEAEKRNAILTHVNKTYTMTEIAKELNMKSATELNKFLADRNIQYKINGTWVFYSDYSNMGYEEIKQEVLDSGKVIYHRKITQTGREFILGLFGKERSA